MLVDPRWKPLGLPHVQIDRKESRYALYPILLVIVLLKLLVVVQDEHTDRAAEVVIRLLLICVTLRATPNC